MAGRATCSNAGGSFYTSSQHISRRGAEWVVPALRGRWSRYAVLPSCCPGAFLLRRLRCLGAPITTPPSMKNLSPAVRAKAIEIANALLEAGMDEGMAIRIAIAHAREWVASHPEGVTSGSWR